MDPNNQNQSGSDQNPSGPSDDVAAGVTTQDDSGPKVNEPQMSPPQPSQSDMGHQEEELPPPPPAPEAPPPASESPQGDGDTSSTPA